MYIFFVVQFMHIILVSCNLGKYFYAFMHIFFICKFMFLQFLINSVYSFFHFVVVLNDSSSHIFSYNLCWQILVLHFCSFIFFYWNDERERGNRTLGRPDECADCGERSRTAGHDGTCRIDRQDRSWRARELEMPPLDDPWNKGRVASCLKDAR